MMKLETMETNEGISNPDWDPMREDYEDSEFNSYVEGPGNKLSSDNQKFTLEVENIPLCFTDQTLFNIFSRYGKVEIEKKFRSKKRSDEYVAYVVYKAQIDANRAIKELHKEEPFFLRLRYTKSKEKKIAERCNEISLDSRTRNLIRTADVPDTKQPEPDNSYAGPKYEEIKLNFFPKVPTLDFCIADNFDPSYCNPFVSFHSGEYKIYPVLDELYSPKFKVGNKKVTLGRCYFVEQEQKIDTSEKPKVFKFGESVETADSGPCELKSCPNKTSMRCTSCHAFYCSEECRNADGEKHKLLCSSLTRKNDDINDPLVPLKVMHVGSDHVYAVKMNLLEKFETLQKRLQEESPKQQRFTRPEEGTQCAVLDKDTHKWYRGIFAQVSAPNHLIFYYDYGFSKTCAASSIRQLHSDLSIDEPFALKIKLSSTNNTIVPGSLLKVSSLEKGNNIYKAVLKEVCQTQSESVCGSVKSLDRTEFFRKANVKIINLSSEEFTEVSIKGMLTASTYFVSWKNLISPEKYEDVCAYIKIDADAKGFYPVGFKLRVRSTCRLASDFFCVETESHLPSCQNELDSDFEQPNSIIKCLKKNDAGKIMATCVYSNTSFLASLFVDKSENKKYLGKCKRTVFETLKQKMKEASEENNFVPGIGSCVAVYHESLGNGTWWRGSVWSVSDMKFVRCLLIDIGSVVSVPLKYVRPLEKSLKTPFSFAVACCVEAVGSGKSLEVFFKDEGQGAFNFIVEKVLSDGTLTCSVKNKEENICSIHVSELNPTVEEIGLKAVELKSKMEVKLCQFYSSSILYVTPVNQTNFIIEQKLAKLIQSSQSMKRLPRFGELVACKWSKNNQYYRAQILEPFSNSQHRIFFVDSGTQEIRTIGEVFELDDELKSYPCLAVKICLKDIDSEPLVDPAAVNYLNSVGFKEEPLKVIFENNDLTAVELHHLNNVIMNERLNHYVKTKNVEHDDEIYFDTVPYSKLKISADVELGVLRKYKGEYMMLEPKSNVAQFVFYKFHDLINEYCENLTNKGYYPRENEVVFAQINTRDARRKCWCRAVVLQNRHLGSAYVQCIDFGGSGEILHTSIRKMHPKFMHVPPVAYQITPKLPEDLSSSQVQRLDSFFNSFATYSGKVISGTDLAYCVDFKFLNDIIKQL